MAENGANPPFFIVAQICAMIGSMTREQLLTHMGKEIPETHLTLLEDLGCKRIYGEQQRVYRVRCACGAVREWRASDIPKTCGGKNCPYLMAINKVNAIANGKKNGIRKRKDSILLKNAKQNFVLVKCTYSGYKVKAIKRGLEWNITPEDIEALWIKQGGRCLQTGVQLSCGNNKHNHTWSLDRIDNNKGYTPDNVQLVSKFYNMVKLSRTDDEMKLIAYLLYQNMSVDQIREYNKMNNENIMDTLKKCTKIDRR